MKLTKKDNVRMQELRNLRMAHVRDRNTIQALRTENTELKARIAVLEKENADLRNEVTDLRYQLQELRTIVFGKRTRAEKVLVDDGDNTPPQTPIIRTKESYQRPVPTKKEITHTEHHTFAQHHTRTRTRVYFVEDVPLSIQKTVTKHVVEQYYDTKRRTWISASSIPSTRVTLGQNVRMLIATLITVDRLSFSQTATVLQTLFQVHVSDGEISAILQSEGHLLRPTEGVLLASIQKEESHHMDESRYDVRGETRYVWNMTGGTSNDTVYRVGVSRGKGIAEELRGDSEGVLVSDDYGAYRTLTSNHQLCYAHLVRKFRDLAESGEFVDGAHEHLVATYRRLASLYRNVVLACQSPTPEHSRDTLVDTFQSLATPDTHDPPPLVRLKKTLMKNIPLYLTCLRFPSIARTNNSAERALRHIVLKPKNSFGVKSGRGATAMGTLFSVLLTLHRRDPRTYFVRYAEVRGV